MKTKIIIIMIVFLMGGAAGFASAYQLMKAPETKEVKAVSVTQLSGKAIRHSEINYSGPTVSFRTKSDGVGEIETSIPKENIPEARAWMEKTNAIILFSQYQRCGDTFYKSVGFGYAKRINSFEFGGGISAWKDNFGAFIQAQYWFDSQIN